MQITDRNRRCWSATVAEMEEELKALLQVIQRQSASEQNKPNKSVDARRLHSILERWRQDQKLYSEYVRAMTRLLGWKPGSPPPGIPEQVMGDPNTVEQLRNYVVGPGRRINYLQALTSIRTRNAPQANVGPRPIDFVAVRDGDAVLVDGDEDHQLHIESRTGEDGSLLIRVVPLKGWGAGYPLALFEDPELSVPGDRVEWLCSWHSDREWLEATHRTRYSNLVVGLQEQFRHWRPSDLPAPFRVADESNWPALLRLVERRRAIVENDLLVLASDHWKFQCAQFQPGRQSRVVLPRLDAICADVCRHGNS
jgi:hypothetical protein